MVTPQPSVLKAKTLDSLLLAPTFDVHPRWDPSSPGTPTPDSDNAVPWKGAVASYPACLPSSLVFTQPGTILLKWSDRLAVPRTHSLLPFRVKVNAQPGSVPCCPVPAALPSGRSARNTSKVHAAWGLATCCCFCLRRAPLPPFSSYPHPELSLQIWTSLGGLSPSLSICSLGSDTRSSLALPPSLALNFSEFPCRLLSLPEARLPGGRVLAGSRCIHMSRARLGTDWGSMHCGRTSEQPGPGCKVTSAQGLVCDPGPAPSP